MWLLFASIITLPAMAANIAYIYGDIAANGTLPSGNQAPYHQMLLTDTGPNGTSQFRAIVESEGHTITQHYDATTTLNPQFLNQFQVIIFSLHQKIWSASEKSHLDAWIRAGGGMFIYSDSAAGGRFNLVGPQNTVGQTAVNNLISQYGMEVTVDQANGTKAYRASPGATHPIVANRPVFEGEGVSPVAVAASANAQILIPYENTPDNRVSGQGFVPHQQNLTISNPSFAALVLKPLGSGNIIVSFDRQPVWNGGEGSDITKRDNGLILRRIITQLAGSNPTSSINVSANTDKLIGELGTATLDGLVTGNPSSTTWSQVSGPGSVNFASANSVDTTATFSQPGSYELMLTASNGASNSSALVQIEVVPNSTVINAINSGSGAYNASTGINYTADDFFVGGHIDNFGGASVAATTDDELYNHARSSQSAYNIPIANGNYTVLLQFSETFFTANNRRVFDVSIEGIQVLNDLDLFATTGSRHSAHSVLADVTVADGTLNMNFAASVNNPLLSAFVVVSKDGTTTPIEPAEPISVAASAEKLISINGTLTLDGTLTEGNAISSTWSKTSGPGDVSFASTTSLDTTATFTQAGTYELMLVVSNGSTMANTTVQVEVVSDSAIVNAVNSGAGAYSAVTGINYSADDFFVDGHIDNFGGASVAATTDDELYNHARSSHSAYNVPVANGNYTVLLQFSETFFTASNRRVFSASVEGTQVINNLDIFATTGRRHQAHDVLLDVTVTDGILNLSFTASINNSLLAAFVVVSK
jgi:phosphatidate phosphatase APP1